MSALIRGSVHCVYHCTSVDGQVVYVGCTGDPQKRAKQNRERLARFGYPDVQIDIVAAFSNRRHALDYELREIRRLRPPVNQQGNPDYHLGRTKKRSAA